MQDEWADRLSEYLDGELTREERSTLEAHLAECQGCVATLDELRGVVAKARTLPERAPEADLWPGIAVRLAPRGSPVTTPGVIDLWSKRIGVRRRFAFTVPQLVAAGITLVVVTSATVYAVLGPGATSAPRAIEDEASVTVIAAPSPVQFASYEETVLALERELALRAGDLDPATVAVVEENLRVINAAIEEARAALADDPSSSYLTTHLAQTMRRKVDLLQRAAMLAGA